MWATKRPIAAKMQIERDGANYTLRNLGGTIMGNAGNALDLLRWTPGVIVGMNEDISLIGRDGKTEVYVDNHKVTDNAQLKAITSQDIKRVEIIREPDAQYASNAGSVIKVFTHSPVKDHLGASLTNVLDIKRQGPPGRKSHQRAGHQAQGLQHHDTHPGRQIQKTIWKRLVFLWPPQYRSVQSWGYQNRR